MGQEQLTPEEFKFWNKRLNDKRWTEHAFKVFVATGTPVDTLVVILSSVYSVVLCSKGWGDINVHSLIRYTSDKVDKDFPKQFLRYICTNRPYMIEYIRDDLNKQDDTKQWIRYLR
tara:strand:- start:8152 stop:8499 length:348 start_codon:yes stop_codon:yes gene_type:complete